MMLNVSKGNMYAFCQCGCGNKTKPNRKTGKPNKFLFHHNTNGLVTAHPGWKGGKIKDPSGYIKVYDPSHPRSQKNHVFEHILIAEKALGKPLPVGVEIHHYGRRDENSKIIICQDRTYHQIIEVRQRAYRSCGNASFRKCRFCQQYDDLDNLFSNGNDTFHRICRNKDYRDRKDKNV